ncbi:MAG: hypothetical protein AAB443_04410, partial [Patescibacteria group bacterium]
GYYAKLPTKSPKFPAYALIRNLGEGYDALFSAGKLGGCSEMTLEVLEKEFPADLIKKLNGNKLFHQFYAVVVAGRKVDGQGNESYFPVSLYFVPIVHFEMWRCDWNMEWLMLPTPGHFPCK